MPQMPSGVVTFLLTDLEDSARLWEQNPDAMRRAIERHEALLTSAIERHGGVVVKSRGEGDSLFAVFDRATDAVAAALLGQKALLSEAWPADTPIRARAALHTGEADLCGVDYFGPAVNRCARLRAIAHGGQTLLSLATVEIVRDALPKGCSLRALGSHRLRSLRRPEEVFQLDHPDLPCEFPPLSSEAAIQRNLPVHLTSFVGRKSEIAQVKELLSEARLVTLTGSGGCGKTRLATQVAAGLIESYPDGVWWVDLSALQDPNLLPEATVSALGLREQPARPVLRTLSDYLGPRKLLLVLDNCEHLVENCAILVDSLLRACLNLSILTTSREALNIGGETTFRVPSLSLPEIGDRAPLDRMLQYEAVRLFVERARSRQGKVPLTGEETQAIIQICRLLDGIPLAIELAASLVNVLSLEQITERLDDRFRLLTGGSRTALPRHQTLLSAIDWSYDLLNEELRRLFDRLSVFVGGFSLEAIVEVCAGDALNGHDILPFMTDLVNKSLVVVQDESEASPRYRLLNTLRQYAKNHLESSGQAEAVQRKHASFFLAVAEDAAPKLTGPEQAVWLKRLEFDHDNLQAAIRWSIKNRELETGLKLGAALWRFWFVRGHLSAGREWIGELLQLRPESDLRELRAEVLYGAGALAYDQSDFKAAHSLWEQSLAVWRELADQSGIARSLNSLAGVAKDLGDYAGAQSLLEESLEILRRSGGENTRAIGNALNNLGILARDEGKYAPARSFLEEGLTIRKRLGDESGIAGSLINLGEVACDEGEYETARGLFQQSLELFTKLGDKRNIARSLNYLGVVATEQGDRAAARPFLEESLTIVQELDDGLGIACSLEAIACLEAEQGWLERALRLAKAAATIRESIGTPVPPMERLRLGRALDLARQGLGAEAYEAAWADEQAMSLEHAISYALEGGGNPRNNADS